jgi:predicted AAA+ superfamily ATPase
MISIIRNVTIKAKEHLQNDEILLFIGARQAGKTTILKQLLEHVQAEKQPAYFLTLEDPDYLSLLNASPKNLFKIFPFDLSKKTYQFIDEIQYLKNPSNFLKFFYDEYKGKIKLLVSGSSAFYVDKTFTDSLAGRKRIFNVRTLSFLEFLRFKNENALEGKKDFTRFSLSEYERISRLYGEYIIYGGYPRVVLAPIPDKNEILRDIAYSYIKKDVADAGVRKEEVFYKLFKMLASQIGSLVNASELAATIGVSKTLIDNYLYVMRKSFHIHLLSPFHKNVRKELTKMQKIYFDDLGLRNFFVQNFNSFEFRDDRGHLLENAVFRQLRERLADDEIRFWRTIQKHEVDFIIEEKQAYEVKTNLKQFKLHEYKSFFTSYPHIPLSLVTLSTPDAFAKGNLKIFAPWEV